MFVISDILLYQLSINNTKQRKLFHWDQRKQFVISDMLFYQISLYRVSTVVVLAILCYSALASYHLSLWLLHLLWLVRLQSFPGGVDAFAPAPLWLSVGELWSHGARGNATWTHITPDDTSSCILHLGKNSVVCTLLLLCSELVRCWQVICCDGYLGGCN